MIRLKQMMNNKYISPFLTTLGVFIITLILTGCSSFMNGFMDGFMSGLPPLSTMNLSSDSDYQELALLMESPDKLNQSPYLNKSICFYGSVSSEPIIFDFGDDDSWDGDALIRVQIARAPDLFMYLNISKLEETPELNKIYEFTASLDGTLYYTENSNTISILSGNAYNIEPYSIQDFSKEPHNIFSVSNGTIELADFQISSLDSSEYELVVYYYFTNTGNEEVRPYSLPLNSWQEGNGSLNETSFALGTLKHTDAVDGFTPIPSGDTCLYYTVYNGILMDSPITFSQYNDDFSISNSMTIDPSQLPDIEKSNNLP